MEAWVIGASGMLGTEVERVLKERGHGVFSPTHDACPVEDSHASWGHLYDCKRGKQNAGPVPDVIINCAGVRPLGKSYTRQMMMSNALGPHILASIGSREPIRLIHMSTDCVFSGAKGSRVMAGKFYSSTENPDPIDLYGRTKLAGEVDAPHVLNVRGSFLGLRHGFLRWVLDYEDAAIPAWQKAYWNGTNVKRMAAHLVDLAEGDRTGIVHVAAPESVTKAWMIGHILKRMEKPTNVILRDEPYINRALWPDIETVPVEQALDELIEEMRGE